MAIGRELFFNLRENYQATPGDVGVLLAALNRLEEDPLLRKKLAVTVMLDSGGCQLFVPNVLGIRGLYEVAECKCYGVVRVAHTPETRRLWRDRIMNPIRREPGGTAWEIGREGEMVWKVLSQPELWAIPDPNKRDSDPERRLMVQDVCLAPPSIIGSSRRCPEIKEFMVCYLEHELEVHGWDMSGMVWPGFVRDESISWDEHFSAAAVFWDLVARKTGKLSKVLKEAEIEYLTEPGWLWEQRRVLGEVLAYMGEIWRAKMLADSNSMFSYLKYTKYTEESVNSLDKIRDRVRYPVAHRNKLGFEIAKAWVERLEWDKIEVLKAMYLIRTMMVGPRMALEMFRDEDVRWLSA